MPSQLTRDIEKINKILEKQHDLEERLERAETQAVQSWNAVIDELLSRLGVGPHADAARVWLDAQKRPIAPAEGATE